MKKSVKPFRPGFLLDANARETPERLLLPLKFRVFSTFRAVVTFAFRVFKFMSSLAEGPAFSALGLLPGVQAAVDDKGYSVPTPIQAQTIPFLLEGRDVLGQASTGTGKTAAFALPLLSKLDVSVQKPQVLVLAPTRELAIQVAASFSAYGVQMPGLNVQAIYGGASYYHQLKELRRGVHVVVGTPGRVMDHMRRGTLQLDGLKCLVLDEADEMLRMGFVDDVRWILEQTPPERQIALFSATMPDPIRRIAQEYLKNPATITIEASASVAPTIRPRYLVVSPRDKTEALIRILETEDADGVIVFVKTRETTVRVADILNEHGFSAIAINGDIEQKQREHTIEQLRSGRFDILVATDVAARGLDVQRISHVINYDLPHDSEAWIHRIGRTGRAGRSGEALLFLSHHERRHLRGLERASRQVIAEMQLPSSAAVNLRRKAEFKKQVIEAIDKPNHTVFRALLQELQQESGRSMEDLAAAVAVIMQGDQPFMLEEPKRPERPSRRPGPGEHGGFDDRRGRNEHRHAEGPRGQSGPRGQNAPRGRGRDEKKPHAFVPGAVPVEASFVEHRHRSEQGGNRGPARVPRDAGDSRATGDRRPTGDSRMSGDSRATGDSRAAGRPRRGGESGMETFRLEIGLDHGVKPSNIVGAIANEAGLDSKNIGRIEIRDNHSFVDLPEGMPNEVFRGLKEVVVLGRHLRISRTRAERGGGQFHTPGRGPRRDREESAGGHKNRRPAVRRKRPQE